MTRRVCAQRAMAGASVRENERKSKPWEVGRGGVEDTPLKRRRSVEIN